MSRPSRRGSTPGAGRTLLIGALVLGGIALSNGPFGAQAYWETTTEGSVDVTPEGFGVVVEPQVAFITATAETAATSTELTMLRPAATSAIDSVELLNEGMTDAGGVPIDATGVEIRATTVPQGSDCGWTPEDAILTEGTPVATTVPAQGEQLTLCLEATPSTQLVGEQIWVIANLAARSRVGANWTTTVHFQVVVRLLPAASPTALNPDTVRAEGSE